MGYIKYSWVRGKHTVQYPELTHVIHTEINYLPGPRAGLHSLRTRFCYTPSSCRRQESWSKNVCDRWNSSENCLSLADVRRSESTRVGVFQWLNQPLPDPGGKEPDTGAWIQKAPRTPMINQRSTNTGYASPLDCSLMNSGATKWHAGTNTLTSRFVLRLVSLWAPPRHTSHIWILHKRRLFNRGVKIEAIILVNASAAAAPIPQPCTPRLLHDEVADMFHTHWPLPYVHWRRLLRNLY